VLTVVLVCALTAVPAKAGEDAALLPDLEGFTKQGEARSFDPDSLYEYVNGDSFTYMGFRFEELTVQEYAAEDDRTVTADLFRHRDTNSGFGIYSYERPSAPELLEIGGEGYYEEGALNFFKGPYYVKLSGSGLGKRDQAVLTELAGAIARKIEGQGGLPLAASCFPRDGLDADSVRYVATDFLGHAFLHSAFTARYEREAGEFRAFIIEPADAADVKRMLADYVAFLEEKEIEYTSWEGVYRFRDPYHASAGLLHLKAAGHYLIGVFSDDLKTAAGLLSGIESKLGS
jgi:hypothetical protein